MTKAEAEKIAARFHDIYKEYLKRKQAANYNQSEFDFDLGFGGARK